MIYIDQSQVDQVEYLLGQAMQGNHVLFSPEIVRKAISEPMREALSEEEAYAMEPHLERLLELPSLEQKRAYLDRLDACTLESVVRAYFNIVENNLYENVAVRH